MTVYVKLPPNSRHLSLKDKFFKTCRCPLKGFTVIISMEGAKDIVLVSLSLNLIKYQRIYNISLNALHSSVHCVKVSVFGVILVRILPLSGWTRTRITPNTDTFYAVVKHFTIEFPFYTNCLGKTTLLIIFWYLCKQLYIKKPHELPNTLRLRSLETSKS